MKKLTEEQRRIMTQIVDGADVYGYGEAMICRQLQRADLVRIVKAKNAPKDGAEKQPYFGAKLTAAGRKLLAA